MGYQSMHSSTYSSMHSSIMHSNMHGKLPAAGGGAVNYSDILSARGFRKISADENYPPEGELYQVPKEMAIGNYWVYAEEELFDIKIHDFYYEKDTVFQLESGEWPSCLNIAYYDSVSGEEFHPYRQLSSGCIKTFFGGDTQFKCVFHKNIPLRSIGIEIFPEYYENYLCSVYGSDYVDPTDAFKNINQTFHFPELVTVFKQIWAYRGTGMGAKMFYRSKVDEIICLILEYSKTAAPNRTAVSAEDLRLIQDVSDYINGHFNTEIRLDYLSTIACMGTTKLKETFRIVHGISISQYIKERRMSHAENLLATTNLPIDQVSLAIGYHNAGRFAAGFKAYCGLYPSEYRSFAKSR